MPLYNPADTSSAIAAVVANAPAALDTLDELAAALGDDASYAATITTALAAKAPLASPTFTGTPAAPTAAAGTNTTQVATTAYVRTAIAFRGAMVTKASDQTTANYTTATAISFDTETYDTDSIHEGVTSPTRLSVPSGVTYVRLSGGVQIGAGTSTDWVSLFFRKNGGAGGGYAGQAKFFVEVGTATPFVSITSPIIPVVGGTDYFELMLQVEADTSITLDSDNTWFAMEIIE